MENILQWMKLKIHHIQINITIPKCGLFTITFFLFQCDFIFLFFNLIFYAKRIRRGNQYRNEMERRIETEINLSVQRDSDLVKRWTVSRFFFSPSVLRRTIKLHTALGVATAVVSLKQKQ